MAASCELRLVLDPPEHDLFACQALGKGGARFTGLVYVFIHYALLVAYMAQGGGLLNDAFKGVVDAGWVSSASIDVILTKAMTMAMPIAMMRRLAVAMAPTRDPSLQDAKNMMP